MCQVKRQLKKINDFEKSICIRHKLQLTSQQKGRIEKAKSTDRLSDETMKPQIEIKQKKIQIKNLSST